MIGSQLVAKGLHLSAALGISFGEFIYSHVLLMTNVS
jgi:hypothetical protein